MKGELEIAFSPAEELERERERKQINVRSQIKLLQLTFKNTTQKIEVTLMLNEYYWMNTTVAACRQLNDVVVFIMAIRLIL